MRNTIVSIIAVLTLVLFLLVGYRSISHGQVQREVQAPVPAPVVPRQQQVIEPPTPRVQDAPKIEIKPEPPKKMPKNYQEALGYVQTSNKSLLLVCYSTTCGPCRAMRATYADPTVKQALNTAGVGLIYYLDVLGPEANVARQFGVQGVPAYFIVDAQGKAINSGVGYLAPEGFIGWLNQGSHILR